MMAEEKEFSNLNCEEQESNLCKHFKLYETRSNFYMIGRDKNRTISRVLKIDRLEPSELNILEDSTMYSEKECCELLQRIHGGNRSTGGLKFVTICYGIIGFIKFLGPYYMLIITKRRKIGAICGHKIYAITKCKMIAVPNSTVRSSVAYSKSENRYKKLLCTVDLAKDFFFSYSYHVMHNLQSNMCENETGRTDYDSMFVWNEFLTRGIRSNLKNTFWTVALVYGFFKQVKLSVSHRDIKLTLIARRSRHYAGTRYLRRGVNEKGSVANDVETEQIVFEDVPEGFPTQITSITQIRGSIPLFWSQETSRLNIKPGIKLSREDYNYEATRLHFENLAMRYGNPILILNLIKTRERKPRETILGAEFANAIRFINKNLAEENRLRFLQWDLNKYSKNKATNVLVRLGKVAAYALNVTGLFYVQVKTTLCAEAFSKCSFDENYGSEGSLLNLSSKSNDSDNLELEGTNDSEDGSENYTVKPPLFQKGVLRTNCIDCLDRTNVAQYAYGLVALGRQLQALGLMESPNIDLDNPSAEQLMSMYEIMGDTLALQYGGSAAHNKIFSESRGQWKAATQSQELFRTLRRFYSNAYMDAEKQDAISIFLGYFQPQQGKPAIWELDADKHYCAKRGGPYIVGKTSRPFGIRSLSDGNILCENNSALHAGHHRQLSKKGQGGNKVFSETDFATCEGEISYSRHIPSVSRRAISRDAQFYQSGENDYFCDDEHGDECNCSKFVDIDWLSSSGNSFEEETHQRSIFGISLENAVASDTYVESSTSASESVSSIKRRDKSISELTCDIVPSQYSESFSNWVIHGEMLFY